MIRSKSSAQVVTAPDGVDIHYWHTKKPEMDKSTVFIQPGAAMNNTSLQGLEKRLNDEGHPTVTIESRGVGFSEAPFERRFYTLEACSGDMQRVIEKEGLEKPSIFCHSYGGMIAFDYVGRTGNAKSITGACVSPDFRLTTVPYVGAWIFGNVMPFSDAMVSFVTALYHWGREEPRPYSDQSTLIGKSILSHIPKINDVPFKQAASHLLSYRELTSWNVSEQLGNISVPIHLINGKLDFMVMPYAAGMIKRRAGRNLPSEERGIVTIDKAWGDHTLPYANPQAVLRVMDKYDF